MSNERFGKVEDANDVSFLAEHLLECLDQLEREHPYFLDSPEYRELSRGDSPFFFDNPRAGYYALKARLIAEQCKPAVDETNLRVIYNELKAYLEDVAVDLANVKTLRSEDHYQLIPEIYLHSNFNLMAAVFMKQLRDTDADGVYTALAEDIVLGERNWLSVPQELSIFTKRKILKVLASDKDEEAQVGDDLRNLDPALALTMFFVSDEELEEIDALGARTAEIGVPKLPIHRLAANVLAARKRIIDVRSEVAASAHVAVLEAEARGERHLKLVPPPKE